MSYPILYKANETDFSHLGLGVLTNTTEALVTEERNGIFEMTMKYPVDGDLFDELKLDRLLKVDANPNLKNQRFKIIRISKPTNGIVTVYAEHISYLAQDLPLKPEVSYNGTAQVALNIWKNNIVEENPLTVYSDITTEGSGKWTIDKVENARRALGGVQGSLLDSYGGEYRFDNYHISLLAQRGNDDGVLIAYGKNLTDLTQEEEITNTYTSIYPYSIIREENETEDEEIITLPEYYVDSEHVDNYARRKILAVDFSEEEITNVDTLRKRAKAYIEDNEIGIPKVNLKVKFIDLAKTLDYKHLQLIENIDLCDWVTVYFEKLGVRQHAKVIKVVWNVLLDRYEEIEIGEARASLSKSIETTVDEKLDPVAEQINSVRVAANGKNKVFRGRQEPTSGMSENDIWYKPVGEGEIELYTFNGTIWELEKVSAGLLSGTLDADVENGDVNLINVNVANIVGNYGNFIQLLLESASSFTSINSKGIRVTNKDGTYTQLTDDGLKRFTSVDERNYHYLIYATTFVYGDSSSSARWIQLPNDFKGKDFQVYLAVADSLNAINYYRSIQRIVATGHPAHKIDYKNARVPIIAYKSETLGDGVKPEITDVQGMLLAIY